MDASTHGVTPVATAVAVSAPAAHAAAATSESRVCLARFEWQLVLFEALFGSVALNGGIKTNP